VQAPQDTLPRWLWLLVPLAALLVVIPLRRPQFSCGGDYIFHMTNWFEAARQWRLGILYPRWASQPNWTAGEPRFIFYPPASWMLGAAIAQVAGLAAAPYVYIFVVLCASAAAMYRFARLTLLPPSAFAAALIYMANPFMLFAAYAGAYAAMLAAAILPLLFLAILRPRVHVALLAETVAALWLCNAPAAVVAMYSLLVLAVCAAWRHRSLANLLRAAAGAALGLGIAAIYILPAAYERQWVQIAKIKQGILDFHLNFLFGPMVGRKQDKGALLLLATVAICTAVLVVRRRKFHFLQTRVFFILAILSGVALLLILPVSNVLWEHIPQFPYLQFPLRWLMVGAPAFALLPAALLSHAARRRVPISVAVIFTMCIAVAGWRWFTGPCAAENTPRAVTAQLRSGAGLHGPPEYTPIGANVDQLQPAAPRVWFYAAGESVQASPGAHRELPEHAHVARWSPADKQFSADLPQPSVAILQLLEYPAWRVTINGVPAPKTPAASSGQIQIALPAGHSDVEVKFVRTRDRLLGNWISVLSIFLLVWVTWRERKHHLHPHPAQSS
jgi:hypothetical protein